MFDHDGSWNELPDFDTLTATERVTTPSVTHEVEGRVENYGLRFTGEGWESRPMESIQVSSSP